MFALTLSRVDAKKSEDEEEKGRHDGEQMLIKNDKNVRIRNKKRESWNRNESVAGQTAGWLKRSWGEGVGEG